MGALGDSSGAATAGASGVLAKLATKKSDVFYRWPLLERLI